MTLKIRLVPKKNFGTTHYNVVVTDSRKPLHSPPLQTLGKYSYSKTGIKAYFNINTQKLVHWITLGAQPSNAVKKILTLGNILGAK